MGLVVVFSLAIVSAAVAEQVSVLPYSMQPRIVGGILAPHGMFPYMVPIIAQHISSQGLEYGASCGASVISEEYVLTAAHCVNGDPISVKIFFGATDTSKDSEPERVEMTVPRENIILHEEWDYSRLHNDIALIKLTEKINFTHLIQPVRLIGRNHASLDGDVAIITGWGSMGSAASHSDLLRYAQLRILPDEVCYNTFRSYYHPGNICIEAKTQSPCSGDSGGAAVIVDREDRIFTQVGIASYVAGGGCEQGKPVVYTRVGYYLDWINKHTGIPIRE